VIEEDSQRLVVKVLPTNDTRSGLLGRLIRHRDTADKSEPEPEPEALAEFVRRAKIG
jgi:hypothetical protein